MSQEIEIEYKNLLTKKEFIHLLRHLSFPEKGQVQTNHYFETKDFSLKKRSAALRIREKNDEFILTLKEPHTIGLLETHDILTKREASKWLKGEIQEKKQIAFQLSKWNINCKELLYYGSLTTLRRELNYKGVLLVLDYSTYNGASDYEFELEAPNEDIGEKIFNEILKEHSIDKKKTPNKIQRFFTTLKK